jgi:hypothetical protein
MRSFSAVLFLALCSCASFDPVPSGDMLFRGRAPEETRQDVSVSVAVLTEQETRDAFGVWMHRKKIQPVWLRIDNRSDRDFVFLMTHLDPDYFSSHETAWQSHFFLGFGRNAKMDDHMYKEKIRPFVPAGSSVEGFVYTNRDVGMKVVSVKLLTQGDLLKFDFLIEMPGAKLDYLDVDFENLYEPDEIVNLDLADLRRALEELPCCVLGGDQKTDGDPLNFAIIGEGEQLLTALTSRGWRPTEKLHAGSLWGTVRSSLFGSEYRTSPISPLYVFGRSQDAGFQKARETVDRRNHLRIWLSPYRFGGKPVWAGQISRDIGVRFSSKTFVTHEIDPQVDEARDYLLQDLLLSQQVESVAWVDGVGAASKDEPRYNFTLSPYFTDGSRLVLLLSDESVPLTEVDWYEWEAPPAEWE